MACLSYRFGLLAFLAYMNALVSRALNQETTNSTSFPGSRGIPSILFSSFLSFIGKNYPWILPHFPFESRSPVGPPPSLDDLQLESLSIHFTYLSLRPIGAFEQALPFFFFVIMRREPGSSRLLQCCDAHFSLPSRSGSCCGSCHRLSPFSLTL